MINSSLFISSPLSQFGAFMADDSSSQGSREVGVTYLMDQRLINARLDRLESSLDGIARAMDSLTRGMALLLQAHSDAHLQQERLTKEHGKKEEADTYTMIKVARDEDLAEQIGRDIYFDLVDHDNVKYFYVKKHLPFHHFKDEVAKEFGIPVQFMRFWLWAKRQNHTYRPHRPVTHIEETQSVGQLREVSNKVHNAELKLFLEVELGPDLRPIAPPEKTKDDILLFFKLYDPVKEDLRYVGRLFVKRFGKPTEILMKLKEMAGYGREEEIVLYEEIKFEPFVMCNPVDRELSYQASQLEDGDIICYQKVLRHPDVPSYLTYRHSLRSQ